MESQFTVNKLTIFYDKINLKWIKQYSYNIPILMGFGGQQDMGKSEKEKDVKAT